MNRHILVIDDDTGIRDSVATALTASGYRVTSLSDAAHADTALAEHPDITVIVTDVWMPGRTGIQLLKSLIDRRATMPTPSVVLMTGGGRQIPIEVTAAIGALHGAVATLVKPFGLAERRNVVAAALQDR